MLSNNFPRLVSFCGLYLAGVVKEEKTEEAQEGEEEQEGQDEQEGGEEKEQEAQARQGEEEAETA
jgi:hypothetical protein